MKILCLIITVIVVCTPGCGGQSEPIDLGDGYRYASSSAANRYIIDQDRRVVVFSFVENVQAFDDFILGMRSPSKMPDIGSQRASDGYGYFILDKRSKKLEVDVDEVHYFEMLEKLKAEN